MGITNRDLAHSEQRKQMMTNITGLATGVTAVIAAAPCACSVDAVQMMAVGLSNSPSYCIYVNRFIVGTGYTTFALGTSFAAVEYGTSGVFGYTLGVGLTQIGSTLTLGLLLTSDLLSIVSAGSNAAVKSLSVNVVLRPLVDVKTHFGLV